MELKVSRGPLLSAFPPAPEVLGGCAYPADDVLIVLIKFLVFLPVSLCVVPLILLTSQVSASLYHLELLVLIPAVALPLGKCRVMPEPPCLSIMQSILITAASSKT